MQFTIRAYNSNGVELSLPTEPGRYGQPGSTVADARYFAATWKTGYRNALDQSKRNRVASFRIFTADGTVIADINRDRSNGEADASVRVADAIQAAIGAQGDAPAVSAAPAPEDVPASDVERLAALEAEYVERAKLAQSGDMPFPFVTAQLMRRDMDALRATAQSDAPARSPLSPQWGPVAAREAAKLAEREARGIFPRHVGTVDTKITVQGVVTVTYRTENDFGAQMMIIIEGTGPDEGVTVKWTGTAKIIWDLSRGDAVTITGTVKDHKEYKGVPQTVMTRCKVAVNA